MVDILNIPAGSEVFVGAPSVPMKLVRFNAIAKAVLQTPGISEAHLPQCYVEGVTPNPAQVLLVVFTSEVDANFVLDQLFAELEKVIPESELIDVWPASLEMPLLETVRNAGCKIFPSTS